MSISTSPALRCPRCSAHVVAGGDWCTLCYADLRPVPPEPPADEEPLAPVTAPVNLELATPSEQPRRGKHARGAAARSGDFDAAGIAPAAQVEELANQLLAELAVAEARNPLGPLAGAVDSTGKRVALMAGGTLALICLLFLVMAGFGALL